MLTNQEKFVLESCYSLMKMNQEGGIHQADITDSIINDMPNLSLRDSEIDINESSIADKSITQSQISNTCTTGKDMSGSFGSNANESTIGDISKLKISMVQQQNNLDSFKFDFVDAAQNHPGNYQNYIDRTLKSMIQLKDLEYDKDINKRKLEPPLAPDFFKLEQYMLNSENKSDSNGKKLLILDLDETLIHSVFDEEEKETSNKKQKKATEGLEIKTVSFYDQDIDEDVKVKVILRPNVKDFLVAVSKNFEVGIFTASVKEYADAVISSIDPNNELISFRLYRDSCIKVGRAYIKDLRIFSNLDMGKVIIIDNSIYSFANQLSNGILVSSFYDNNEDKELMNIVNYLEEYLLPANDIRFVNEQVFRFETIYEEQRKLSKRRARRPKESKI